MRRDPQDVILENARLSEREASFYDRNHFEIFHPWEQQRLRRHLGRYGHLERVLDVGAGTGNLVTKASGDLRVAVDLSPHMLRGAQEKDGAVAPVLALAEALPFREGSFGLVATYSTLHHLAGWSALAEMRRVTRPGGVVLLEHEEAFREPGWRALAYGVIGWCLRAVAAAWYWRHASPDLHRYRRVSWPYSDDLLKGIDFSLTDGGHPDPDEIEAVLAGLGMSTRRRHYLLLPLPMTSRWQRLADSLCARCRLGHFAIEATR